MLRGLRARRVTSREKMSPFIIFLIFDSILEAFYVLTVNHLLDLKCTAQSRLSLLVKVLAPLSLSSLIYERAEDTAVCCRHYRRSHL